MEGSYLFARLILHENNIPLQSGILGDSFLDKIKSEDFNYNVVFDNLVKFPNFISLINISSIVYQRTLLQPTIHYCQKKILQIKNWDIFKYSVMPMQVFNYLNPIYQDKKTRYMDYINNIYEGRGLLQNEINKFSEEAKHSNNLLIYNMKNCSSTRTQYKIFLKVFPSSFEKFLKISSPQTPFPRTQYYIQGYTYYIGGKNTALPLTKLKRYVKTIYEHTAVWLKQEIKSQSFFEFIVSEGVQHGVPIENTLLLLAFLSRNLPHLELFYVKEPKKSLFLELFFWDYSQLWKQVLSENPEMVFPNMSDEKEEISKTIEKSKRMPSVYHFTTALLSAYTLRKDGLDKYLIKFYTYGGTYFYKYYKNVQGISKCPFARTILS